MDMQVKNSKKSVFEENTLASEQQSWWVHPDYDVAIVGAGAGGITTAIYCARAGLKVALIESGLYGGQINNAGVIENYTGVPQISGYKLASEMSSQAKTQDGIDHIYGNVKSIIRDMGAFKIRHDGGEVWAKTAVIASGVSHKKLQVDGESQYSGRGVSYCAVCDGGFFTGKDVAVIGGGDSAVESALYLSEIARRVTVVHRRDELRAEKVLQDRLFDKNNIEVIWNSNVVEFKGQGGLIFNTKEEDRIHLGVEGSFIKVGVSSSTSFLEGELRVVRNLDGFIITDSSMRTGVEGLYAVGDVRAHSIRQIVNATGDGAMAADSIIKYLQ